MSKRPRETEEEERSRINRARAAERRQLIQDTEQSEKRHEEFVASVAALREQYPAPRQEEPGERRIRESLESAALAAGEFPSSSSSSSSFGFLGGINPSSALPLNFGSRQFNTIQIRREVPPPGIPRKEPTGGTVTPPPQKFVPEREPVGAKWILQDIEEAKRQLLQKNLSEKAKNRLNAYLAAKEEYLKRIYNYQVHEGPVNLLYQRSFTPLREPGVPLPEPERDEGEYLTEVEGQETEEEESD